MKQNESKRGERTARGLASGVVALSLSTLAVKIIGLAFKIPMLSLLGTEGMGYFNSAYEIYALLCVIATAGLPVALSISVSAARAAGDLARVRRVYGGARRIFVFIGISGSAAMAIFARPITELIGNPDAYGCILAISPALFFICIASAVRGYCQGFGEMGPTAVSQLIEAVSKLALGMGFALLGLRRGYGLPTVAALAVLGITVGTLLSAIYMLVSVGGKKYRIVGNRDLTEIKADRSTYADIVRMALPITLGSSIIGLTRIIDMTLIMQRLQDMGVSAVKANSIYGAYTTLAVPVFNLIPALIAPVAMALVPDLSAAVERRDERARSGVIETAMRMTTIAAIPTAMGVAVFARPILELLFSGQSEAIDVAAPMLSALGVSVLFSCLMTTANAILQAQGRVVAPIISMSVGVVLKAVSTYILIGIPNIGVLGAPIGSLICGFAVCVLDLWFMSREHDGQFSPWRVLILPLFAACPSLGAALAVFRYAQTRADGTALPLMLSIAVAAAVYGGVSLLIGNIKREDLSLLRRAKNKDRTNKLYKNK